VLPPRPDAPAVLPGAVAYDTGQPPVGDHPEIAELAIEAGDAARRRRKGLTIGAWLALGWMALMIVFAVFAPLLPVGDPDQTITLHHPCPQIHRLGRLREVCDIGGLGPFAEDGPARGYLLGGDGNSRSMLARLVYGTRTSLGVSTGAVAIGFVIGGMLGMLAGYFGGRIDSVITNAFNVMLSIPAIVLAFALVAFLQQPPGTSGGGESALPSWLILIIAIGVVAIPLLGRITRASALSWSQREFVLAARAQGAKNLRIMIREVLPNVLPAMFSIALLGIAVAIVAEGALAILGVGVAPPTPSWGNIIGLDRESLNQGSPHIVLEPAIMIFLTVLSLNFLGDVVRARFDVREAGI
jgi:peptide/nickel transport system permease protein